MFEVQKRETALCAVTRSWLMVKLAAKSHVLKFSAVQHHLHIHEAKTTLTTQQIDERALRNHEQKSCVQMNGKHQNNINGITCKDMTKTSVNKHNRKTRNIVTIAEKTCFLRTNAKCSNTIPTAFGIGSGNEK